MVELDHAQVRLNSADNEYVKIKFLRLTGAEPTESGLKANSGMERYRKQHQSAQQAQSGQQLITALERINVEKTWERDLINLTNLSNYLNEVGIQLSVHRYS